MGTRGGAIPDLFGHGRIPVMVGSLLKLRADFYRVFRMSGHQCARAVQGKVEVANRGKIPVMNECMHKSVNAKLTLNELNFSLMVNVANSTSFTNTQYDVLNRKAEQPSEITSRNVELFRNRDLSGVCLFFFTLICY